MAPNPAQPQVSSPRPVEPAFRAMLRSFGRLQRVMHGYFAQHGLSGSQWGVLRALHRAEQEGHASLRTVDLSERLIIRPPSVTGAVDRLQRMGLVLRKASRDDARVRSIALTAKAKKLIDHVLVGHPAQLELVLAGLTDDELASLQQIHEKLIAQLETLESKQHEEPTQSPRGRRSASSPRK